MRSKPTNGSDFDSALSVALSLLKVQDRSESELLARLGGRGITAEIAATVVEQLRERGLVNDGRLIERIIEQNHRPGSGRLKVKAKLISRGIDETVADQALAAIDDATEVRHALDSLVGKAFIEDPGKAYRQLANRGYEEEIVERALATYYQDRTSMP